MRTDFRSLFAVLALLGLVAALQACRGSDGALGTSTTTGADLVALAVSPNPATTEAEFQYTLATPARSVALRIYDTGGGFVRSYDDLRADLTIPMTFKWDLVDFRGHRVGNGVYPFVFEIEAGERKVHTSGKVAVAR